MIGLHLMLFLAIPEAGSVLAHRAKAGTAGSDHDLDSGTLATATSQWDHHGPEREDARIQQAARDHGLLERFAQLGLQSSSSSTPCTF